MNDRDTPQAIPATSASQQYVLVSLAALGVILLVLLHWGMGRWSFLPVLIGLLGVILRWRLTDPGRPALDRGIARLMSPLVTVVLLAVLLLTSEAMELPARGVTSGFSLSDWLLSGAVLALCLAQYRLLAMTVSIFPEEHTRHQLRPAAQASGTSPHHRNPQSVTPTEISWLVLSLPIWAFLAQLCWRLLPAGVPPYDLTERTWQGIVLLWLLVLSVLVIGGVRSYTDQRRLGRREARLFLQDSFWQETNHEQRRLGRWLAWARLRRRRKEKS
jgi:hypothetical protein